MMTIESGLFMRTYIYMFYGAPSVDVLFFFPIKNFTLAWAGVRLRGGASCFLKRAGCRMPA